MTSEVVRKADFSHSSIHRCENDEVICYVGAGNTNPLFCKFKEQK